MSKYDYFEPSKPRKTDEGIKARTQRGNFVEHWWAERWIKSLERITDAGRLRRGRSYARGGQVLSIEENTKEHKVQIHARVQGSRSTPYKITLQLQPLSDPQWHAVLAALSERAIFSAQLLAGEMPQEIEEAFMAAGVSLLPTARTELETTCTCPDWANPCKHVAAVHYILGELFDEDPFLIFRLRGRSQEEIMAALRTQRQPETTAAPVVSEQPATYAVAEENSPLAGTSTTFWQMSQTLGHFSTTIQAPTQPYPVLRRLGPPAFEKNLEARLEPIYDAMTREALRMAFVGDTATPDDAADSAREQDSDIDAEEHTR